MGLSKKSAKRKEMSKIVVRDVNVVRLSGSDGNSSPIRALILGSENPLLPMSLAIAEPAISPMH